MHFKCTIFSLTILLTLGIHSVFFASATRQIVNSLDFYLRLLMKLIADSSPNSSLLRNKGIGFLPALPPSSSHPPAILQPSSSHPPAILHPSSSHPPAILQPSSSYPPAKLQLSSGRPMKLIADSSPDTSSHPQPILHPPAIPEFGKPLTPSLIYF